MINIEFMDTEDELKFYQDVHAISNEAECKNWVTVFCCPISTYAKLKNTQHLRYKHNPHNRKEAIGFRNIYVKYVILTLMKYMVKSWQMDI